MNPTYSSFSEEDLKFLEPFLKIGLLATINPDGLPHLTFISSLRPNTATQLTFGQFSEGKSKEYIRENPKVGFLMMTLQKDLWRGKATFTHTARQGAEYDYYNNVPMFRYNSYFGVHTVYYLDLLYHIGRQPLPMNQIIPAAILTILAKTLSPLRHQNQVFNFWTRQMLARLDTLKFLAYIDQDGYPMIIPVIQAQPAGYEHLLFSARVYGAELEQLRRGTPVAILGLALSMEDVLLRGEFLGLKSRAGILCGAVKINWVYNSMPPAPGQIYPPLPLEPVREF
ncbi:MAG: hypothetical protein ANABAC_2513 [Anaerolineae bacterium]|jgi:hypothetical protein|nr:MAG: hypothetical protein ANABAC_2513 [Anaerolineae bacterium]